MDFIVELKECIYQFKFNTTHKYFAIIVELTITERFSPNIVIVTFYAANQSISIVQR